MRLPAILLLLATALAAGEAAPAAPGELKLDALPLRVQRNTGLQFEKGRLNGVEDTLEITVEATLPGGQRILDVGEVAVVEAVGDGGGSLAPNPEDHGAGSSGNGSGTLSLTANLLPPPAGTRTLQRLVLAATVTCAAPGMRRAVLKPAKAWIAKRMRVDGYPGAEVELEDLGAELLSLGMTPALEQALEDTTFRRADGSEIEAGGTNEDRQGGWIVHQFHLALPADGQIVLDLRQGVSKRRVVLTATGILLAPSPRRASQPVGTLPTELVEPGKDAAVEPVELKPVEVRPGF